MSKSKSKSEPKPKPLIEKAKQRLLYLQWQDAHATGGWYTPDELQKEIDETICVIEQVGWVVFEDMQEIHLCGRRLNWDRKCPGKSHEYGSYQRIPKAWILKKLDLSSKINKEPSDE
jgi:hypothetical protein